MIQYSEVKIGDYLLADNEGNVRRGQVTRINGDEKQISLNTGVQEFYYELDQLFPIPITEEELDFLKFTHELQPDGTVKYSKGAFRMLIPTAGDFSKYELWYRDEKRHIIHPMAVHNLQNHFHEMTKMHLDDATF